MSRNRPRPHVRRQSAPYGEPGASRLRVTLDPKAREAVATMAGLESATPGRGPKHVYYAPVTRAQANQYGCIEYAARMGLMARRIYTMAMHPVEPTGYMLVVMSGEAQDLTPELPLLFPGVAEWTEGTDAVRDGPDYDGPRYPGKLYVEF